MAAYVEDIPEYGAALALTRAWVDTAKSTTDPETAALAESCFASYASRKDPAYLRRVASWLGRPLGRDAMWPEVAIKADPRAAPLLAACIAERALEDARWSDIAIADRTYRLLCTLARSRPEYGALVASWPVYARTGQAATPHTPGYGGHRE